MQAALDLGTARTSRPAEPVFEDPAVTDHPARGWAVKPAPSEDRSPTWPRDAPVEVRPADICDPHVKDEHPVPTRLRQEPCRGHRGSRRDARFTRRRANRCRFFDGHDLRTTEV